MTWEFQKPVKNKWLGFGFIGFLVLFSLTTTFSFGFTNGQAHLSTTLKRADNINQIQKMISTENRIWASTPSAILSLDLKNNQWSALVDEKEDPIVGNIESLGKDVLWIATATGLYRMELDSLKYKIINKADGLLQDQIALMACDRGSLWASYTTDVQAKPKILQLSSDGNLVRHRNFPEAPVYKAIISDEDGSGPVTWSDHRMEGILTNHGVVWVSFSDLVQQFDPKTGKFKSWDYEKLVGNNKASPGMSYKTQWIFDPRYPILLVEKHSAGSGHPFKTMILKYDSKQDNWLVDPANIALPGAKDSGLMWVGSSYDVQSASRFVLRYLRDADQNWKDFFYFDNYPNISFNYYLPIGNTLWMGTSDGLYHFEIGSKTGIHYLFDTLHTVYNLPTSIVGDQRFIPLRANATPIDLKLGQNGDVPLIEWPDNLESLNHKAKVHERMTFP